LIPLNDNSSLQIKEGDYVVGFYLDGLNCHAPVIMGILPGIPVALNSPNIGFTDPRTGSELSRAPRKPGSGPVRYPAHLGESTLSRLARNEKISDTPIQSKKSGVTTGVSVAGGGSWSEPKTPYATVYPYNRVMETESGHILEFDDTPGAERVHIYHRSGTFDEVHPDGTKVTKIKASAYEVVLSDKHVYVKGDLTITSDKNVSIKAGKDVTIEAGGSFKVTAGASVEIESGADMKLTAGAGMTLKGIPMNWN
jgi:hypothetical protein